MHRVRCDVVRLHHCPCDGVLTNFLHFRNAFQHIFWNILLDSASEAVKSELLITGTLCLLVYRFFVVNLDRYIGLCHFYRPFITVFYRDQAPDCLLFKTSVVVVKTFLPLLLFLAWRISLVFDLQTAFRANSLNLYALTPRICRHLRLRLRLRVITLEPLHRILF